VADFLALRGVSKFYGGVVALDGLNFNLAAGEVHCLLGENGSGKSTLIKIICGVERPEPGGIVEIEGVEIPHLTSARANGYGIQVIYQDLSLFPNLTVAENIASDDMMRGSLLIDGAGMRAHAKAAMARVRISLDLDAKVGDLPIAQRQLVAICRALVAKARLVIMDEPTASLTRQEVNALIALVRQLKSEGVSIIFVSHRLDEVLEIAERVTVLRDGRSLGAYDKSQISKAMLSVLMTGKEFHYQPRRMDFSSAAPVLSASRLTRAGEYEDISFVIRPGEILAITGLIGSGRTELALTLFGMTRPDSGELAVGGRPAAMRSNREAIAEGVAYVPEDRLSLGLVLPQSIASNAIVTIMDRLKGLFGLFRRAARDKTAAYWIRQLSIKASDPRAPVRTLSGGNQQRVVLAKWLAMQPRVLILDSPTVGVDISAKDGIYEIIAAMSAEGVAVILISDEISEALYHSHRVMVMRQGKKVSEHVSADTSEQELTEIVHA
jgi:simple sugar transport system ATP-binding protein